MLRTRENVSFEQDERNSYALSPLEDPSGRRNGLSSSEDENSTCSQSTSYSSEHHYRQSSSGSSLNESPPRRSFSRVCSDSMTISTHAGMTALLAGPDWEAADRPAEFQMANGYDGKLRIVDRNGKPVRGTRKRRAWRVGISYNTFTPLRMLVPGCSLHELFSHWGVYICNDDEPAVCYAACPPPAAQLTTYLSPIARFTVWISIHHEIRTLSCKPFGARSVDGNDVFMNTN